jgi:hypothetical protein
LSGAFTAKPIPTHALPLKGRVIGRLAKECPRKSGFSAPAGTALPFKGRVWVGMGLLAQYRCSENRGHRRREKIEIHPFHS